MSGRSPVRDRANSSAGGREDRTAQFRHVDMTNIKLLLVTALAILAAAMAGQTLSSDPEWHSLPAKGTDVAMEELTLSYELREGALTGDVDVAFKSDYLPLN